METYPHSSAGPGAFTFRFFAPDLNMASDLQKVLRIMMSYTFCLC